MCASSRIVAQAGGVVDVAEAERDAVGPLAQHLEDLVPDLAGLARIGDRCGERLRRSQAAVDGGEEREPAEVALALAVERNDERLVKQPLEQQLFTTVTPPRRIRHVRACSVLPKVR